MKIKSQTFEGELRKQLISMPHLITEDLIRHWFILDQKLNLLNVEIEKQYKSLCKKPSNITISDRSRIDLFYNIDNTAIEFKFHRATCYSDNCTATKAGFLFRDFNRLSLLKYNDKYVVYVLDDGMLNYYKKEYQPLISNFVNKKSVSNFDFDKMKVGKEFKKGAFSSFSVGTFNQFNYNVSTIYANKLNGTNYHLIIFKVY